MTWLALDLVIAVVRGVLLIMDQLTAWSSPRGDLLPTPFCIHSSGSGRDGSH